jgi:hypothetical protein
VRAILIAMALALAVLIQPTGSKAEFLYAGVGATACGKLSQDYQRNPTAVEGAMMNWAQGFMTGANIRESKQSGRYRDLQAMTIEAQQESLRNYCDEHPMAEFIKAAIDLWNKLPWAKLNSPASTSQ